MGVAAQFLTCLRMKTLPLQGDRSRSERPPRAWLLGMQEVDWNVPTPLAMAMSQQDGVSAAPNDIMFPPCDSAGRVPHPAPHDQGRKIKWNLNLIPDKV